MRTFQILGRLALTLLCFALPQAAAAAGKGEKHYGCGEEAKVTFSHVHEDARRSRIRPPDTAIQFGRT